MPIRRQQFHAGQDWKQAAAGVEALARDAVDHARVTEARLTNLETAHSATYGLVVDSSKVLWAWNGVDATQFYNDGTGDGASVFTPLSKSGVASGSFEHDGGSILADFVDTGAEGHFCWTVTDFRPPPRFVVRWRVANYANTSGNDFDPAIFLFSNRLPDSGHYAMMLAQDASTTTKRLNLITAGAAGTIQTAQGSSYAYSQASPGVAETFETVVYTAPAVASKADTKPNLTVMGTGVSVVNTAQGFGCYKGDFGTLSSDWANITSSAIGVGGRVRTSAGGLTVTASFDIQEFYVLKHPLDW